MSGSWSLGDNGTWQVICLASIGVMYFYTTARWPSENAKEVVERWRTAKCQLNTAECSGNMLEKRKQLHIQIYRNQSVFVCVLFFCFFFVCHVLRYPHGKVWS